MQHQSNSPIPVINRAWRRITVGVIATVVAYKAYVYYTRLEDDPRHNTRPGAFTGEYVQPVERKSKYEGAGNSYLGRKSGDRLS